MFLKIKSFCILLLEKSLLELSKEDISPHFWPSKTSISFLAQLGFCSKSWNGQHMFSSSQNLEQANKSPAAL